MLGPLTIKAFRRLWLSTVTTLVGDGVFLVALVWKTYEIEDSPAAFGLVGAAWTGSLAASLVAAGVLSDRVSRRRLLIAGEVIRGCAVVLVLTFVTTDMTSVGRLAIAMIVYGIGEAATLPAMDAFIPEIVGSESLLAANSLDRLGQTIALRFFGPLGGGWLVATVGVVGALWMDLVTFGVSIYLLTGIPSGSRASTSRATLMADAMAGLRYVRRERWIWVALLASSAALLASAGAWQALVPHFVKHDLRAGPNGLGIVLAAGGVATILAALLLTRAQAHWVTLTLVYLTWGVGVGLTTAFGVVSSLPQAIVVAAMSLGLIAAGTIIWKTLLGKSVPNDLLGRVSSLDWLVSIGLVPMSFALVGPLSNWVGTRGALVFAGIAGSASLALCAFVPGARPPQHALLGQSLPTKGRVEADGSSEYQAIGA